MSRQCYPSCAFPRTADSAMIDRCRAAWLGAGLLVFAAGKQWMIQSPTPSPAQPPEKELARMYCQRMYNPVAVTFEFPWFGRTPDDVRATGRTALWALLRALDEPLASGTR